MQVQVFKFGGSSLDGAQAITRVAEIIQNTSQPTVIVLSAMAGVTDNLLQGKIQPVQERYQNVAQELDVEFIVSDLDLSQPAEILALGERWMAKLMTAVLQKKKLETRFVDAKELICVEPGAMGWVQDAEICRKRAQKIIIPILKSGVFPVIPGFIAEGPQQKLVTLGRGGTDYSATILAAALEAEKIIFYKEVPGMLTADPKYVPQARLIPELHYQEAAELSYYGAKILHPRAIIPLVEPRIPLWIKHTLKPQNSGTCIADSVKPGKNPVRALTAIQNQALIDINGCGMMGVPGVAMRTFKALCEAKISVTLISQASSEASICLTVSEEFCDQALDALKKEFHHELKHRAINSIHAKPSVAIIAVVGMEMKGKLGLSARVFGVFKNAAVNIMAIAQGASEFNISMVIQSEQISLALQTLHHEFFGSEIPNEAQLVFHGFGQIAQALSSQILTQKDYLQQEFGVSLSVVALQDSLGSRQVQMSALPALIKQKKQKEPIHEFEKDLNYAALGLTQGILIDLTASSETYGVLIRALEAGLDVILANKKPLTGSYENYVALFEKARSQKRQIRYEATVGAGLPILDTLAKLKQAGDSPLSIEGCFSGTLGFVMTALDSGVLFSEAVRQALALGLTEPNPDDDLAGMDVARKALILARGLGLKQELSEIEVESLVGIEDQVFTERVLKAQKSGKRLRYVAQVIPGEPIRVGLQEVGMESPFYFLLGTTNQVSMKTPRYLQSPLVVTGPGAGAGVTAAGVLNDIVALAVRARAGY